MPMLTHTDPHGPHNPMQIILCDLSEPDSVKACAAAITSKVSSLDILVNNAGILVLTAPLAPTCTPS